MEGAGKFGPLRPLWVEDLGVEWGRETRRVCDSVGGVGETGELGALLFLGARAIAFLFPEGHRKRWWKGMFLGRCGPSREI